MSWIFWISNVPTSILVWAAFRQRSCTISSPSERTEEQLQPLPHRSLSQYLSNRLTYWQFGGFFYVTWLWQSFWIKLTPNQPWMYIERFLSRNSENLCTGTWGILLTHEQQQLCLCVWPWIIIKALLSADMSKNPWRWVFCLEVFLCCISSVGQNDKLYILLNSGAGKL